MSKGYRVEMIRTGKGKYALGSELLESIRAIDRFEIEGMGFTTECGIRTSINETSPVYAARADDNGQLIAVWGLGILLGKEKNTYIIWAFGTDELQRFRKSFMKESKQILTHWMDMYGELTNTVACCNQKSIAWLKWLGAEFTNKRKFNNVEYVDFYLRKKG